MCPLNSNNATLTADLRFVCDKVACSLICGYWWLYSPLSLSELLWTSESKLFTFAFWAQFFYLQTICEVLCWKGRELLLRFCYFLPWLGFTVISARVEATFIFARRWHSSSSHPQQRISAVSLSELWWEEIGRCWGFRSLASSWSFNCGNSLSENSCFKMMCRFCVKATVSHGRSNATCPCWMAWAKHKKTVILFNQSGLKPLILSNCLLNWINNFPLLCECPLSL